jgi:hypothetical protein
VLKLPGIEVEVAFHEPVFSTAVTSRKVLGPELRSTIHNRLAQARTRAAATIGVPAPELAAPPRDELPQAVAQ